MRYGRLESCTFELRWATFGPRCGRVVVALVNGVRVHGDWPSVDAAVDALAGENINAVFLLPPAI